MDKKKKEKYMYNLNTLIRYLIKTVVYTAAKVRSESKNIERKTRCQEIIPN